MNLLITVIVLALIFDYINGFHDAANSIATVVSTKVLTPFQAVVWAAVFNFVAFFIFKDHGVANTVAKTVKEDAISGQIGMVVILSGLIAAIIWNLLTWWFGIPSSSSHTLIGGFAGAGIAHAGLDAINSSIVLKTAGFILLAPLVGMIMAFIISLWFIFSFRKGWGPKVLSLLIIAGLVMFLLSSTTTNRSEIAGLKLDKDGSGMMVSALASNSPASKMGFRKGQVITAINNEPVTDQKDINQAFRKLHSGDAFTVSLLDKQQIPQTRSVSYQANYDSHFNNVLFYGQNFKWFLLGLILFALAVFTFWLNTLNATASTAWFKRLQLVSSAAFSIGHGGNDAQKVMGIIMAALVAYNSSVYDLNHMPNWVPLACYAAISLGTISGGWKIIKTMGTRITKVTPFEGVAAETAGAITLFVTEALKIPVSTTHTITGAIIGVGATKRLSAVRWGVTISLLWAWILTIPVSALLAAGVYSIAKLFF
jgi:PiT family inorganic phosphate transporter